MVPPTLVPSAAGPALEREVATLGGLLESPARPFVAVLGGAKVSDKLGVVRVLAQRCDAVLVGGAMSFTFAAAQGHAVGASIVDAQRLAECVTLLAGGRIHLPIDARGLAAGEPFGRDGGPDGVREFGEEIPEGCVGLDIGPESASAFAQVLAGAATILWNGPMGVFEDARFAAGTEAVARAVASSGAVSVVGGGDSVAALHQFGLTDEVTFVSTGGGASLEFVEFGDLPGLRALRESPFA